MILDCETLAIDNSWSLTRTNACHIANQNEEMGVLSQSQVEIRNDQKEFGFRLNNIELYISVNTWIWGVIMTTIITVMVKRLLNQKTINVTSNNANI